MDPAEYSSNVPCDHPDEVTVNRRNMTAIEEMRPTINLGGLNALNECKFGSGGMRLDTYNEYIRVLKAKDAARQENGNYHVGGPVPVHLLQPPQQIIANNNNNNSINNNFNKKGGWKNRLHSIVHSPQDSESDESGQPYIARKLSLENRVNQNIGILNGIQIYDNVAYNRHNNNTNGTQQVYNASQVQLQTTQYQGTCTYKPRYYSNSNTTTGHRWDKRRHPQEIYRRVYGLMERFMSRSHLLRITKPLSLIMNSSYSHLSRNIWDVFCEKAQKEETYLHKLELWKMVHLHIRKILLRYGLFMVGSTMSGLGMETSDIDMCLLVKPCLNNPRSDALGYLQNIQSILLNCDFVTMPEVILAKVPILKFRDSRYGFEIDLNCNNAVGIRNTHLLHCYAYLDWRVRPLVIVIKHWAQVNDINDAKRMTISSYSLALMVVHFLQCGVSPAVAPCLHALYPDKFTANSDIHSIDTQEELPAFRSGNGQTLGELLLGFLGYYSCFDYEKCAVSVRERAVLPKDECRYAKSPKNDATQWKLLCIEEPFDLTNTARSVYDVDTFERIKHIFRLSYEVLGETKVLGSILPVPDVYRR